MCPRMSGVKTQTFSACSTLATHATQAIAFGWKPGLRVEPTMCTSQVRQCTSHAVAVRERFQMNLDLNVLKYNLTMQTAEHIFSYVIYQNKPKCRILHYYSWRHQRYGAVVTLSIIARTRGGMARLSWPG